MCFLYVCVCVQRRKSAEDELAMREFLVEGDVISAEVQQIFHDGALGLHTRSLKYGKLAHGSMVAVSSKLIKRCKNHFHELPCGVFLVLGTLRLLGSAVGSVKHQFLIGVLKIYAGTNGYVWMGAPPPVVEAANDEDEAAAALAAAAPIEVSPELRDCIARVRNVVVALAQELIGIFDTTIALAYEDSLEFATRDMLRPDVVEKVCYRARSLGAAA
jgi:exosome complex component RRP4